MHTREEHAENVRRTLEEYEHNRPSGCTCDYSGEFPELRHEPGCALAPDIDGWLFYPHDGELERGGVWVNPDDRGHIVLDVRGHLLAVALGEYDDELERP